MMMGYYYCHCLTLSCYYGCSSIIRMTSYYSVNVDIDIDIFYSSWWTTLPLAWVFRVYFDHYSQWPSSNAIGSTLSTCLLIIERRVIVVIVIVMIVPVTNRLWSLCYKGFIVKQFVVIIDCPSCCVYCLMILH